jgi:hypothetical protein
MPKTPDLDSILRDIEQDDVRAAEIQRMIDTYSANVISPARVLWLRDRERLRSAIHALKAAEEALRKCRYKAGSHTVRYPSAGVDDPGFAGIYAVADGAINEMADALASLKAVK